MRRTVSPWWLSVVLVTSIAGCVPDQRPGEGQTTGAPVPRPPTPAIPPPPIASVPSPFATALRLPNVPLGSASASAGALAAAMASAAPAAVEPRLVREFRDSFDRDAPGPDWNLTSPVWRIQGGRFCGQGAHNHPAWLRRILPVNARIEFDVTSASLEGDIKAEFWGDGKSAAQTVSYTAATSYLTIFGGWKNQFHVLARVDEHAPDRPEIRIDEDSQDLRARRVEPNRVYHFKVVRDDRKTIRWFVDDIELFTFTDKVPLLGTGHDHLGFNDWDVALCFDNLVVTPLPD